MPRDDEAYTGDIPANFRGGHGLDPNHRGGYQGMRMRGGRWQAEYGLYRAQHSQDLGGYGGFWGREEPHAGADAEYGREAGAGGGVQPSFEDQEYLRDFNSRSPAFEPSHPAPGEPGAEENPPTHPFGLNAAYANGGLAGGFSQGWLGATAKPRGPSSR